MDILSDDEITAALCERPDWVLADDGRSISRSLRFEDFSAAFGFMTAVALDAQAANHHPDWSNSWATVDITLSTHSAGGLTDADFALAERIDHHAATAEAFAAH